MRKILICGLGAVGLTYAVKFKANSELKILVDKERLERYNRNKPIFNGVVQEFDYILPDETFTPDLIILATKSQGLDDAIKNIKNFVNENTIIISLLNGISSEEKIQEAYPNATVLKSYFIGHSAVRVGNSVTQDAAILNMNFGELKRNQAFLNFAKKIILEVRTIAQVKGVKNLENLENDALAFLNKMCDEGKTSMLQDILAGRKTEVEIFAGEIIRLGKKFNLPTSYNQVLYDLIKIVEEK